jgi:Vitamin K-dependent gamma-carboxylase
MQIQVSVIYVRTVLWKLKAKEWLDGSAVFYAVYRNLNVRRLFYEVGAYSWFACAPFAACLTWFTLTGELFTGIFIWFQETRNAALVVAAVTQLGFGLVFSIKQFQWLMLVSLLLFLTAQDWLTLRAAVESAWH